MNVSKPVCALLLIAASAQGQQQAMYDQQFHTVHDPKLAVYYGPRTSGAQLSNDNGLYYYASGKERKTVSYLSASNHTKHGKTAEYYADGSVMGIEYYENGLLNGELKRYWPNGKLRREETYRYGELLESKCYDVNGAAAPYSVYRTKAEFPGGLPAFYSYLSKNIRIPKDLEAGGIKVMFRVTAQGEITNVRLLTYLNDETLEHKIVRVFTHSDRWIPAMEEGQPLDTDFALPMVVRQ